jgi:hypothetical protein
MRTVLALLLLVAGVFGSAQDAEKSDSQVVNAALLSFFEKADWQTFEWQQGDFVLVEPELKADKKTPEDYVSVLKQLVRDSEEPNQSLKTLAEKYKKGASRGKFDLASLELDSRIVIDSPEARGAKEGMIRNREGTFGTIRATGRLLPPLYSSDRQSAIVRWLSSWSFGRHGAWVAFVLQKIDDKWKVVLVQPKYYF